MSLQVGVVGAGSMGANHLRVLRDLGDDMAQLVAVAEPDDSARERAQRRFGAPGFANYREMIERAKPDLVVVAAPTHLHFEVGSFALEHDVHVLIEKPIASTLDEAAELVALAKARGLRLAVGHVERFNPAILALKSLLAREMLGKVYYLHARRLGPFPPRIRDVGVILDLATHDLDVMRYLTASEAAHVYAESQQRVHQTREDLLLGLIRFENDAIGMLDINWLTPTKVRELSVTGERGMYQVNYLTQDLYFYENDYTAVNWDALRSLTGVSEGTMTRLKVQKAEPLRLEYEDVLGALREDRAPTVTGEDGLAALRMAHQLIEASQENRVVRAAGTISGVTQ
jgi:UDP-N-acetylglucosamine 3-dehydrogenase